MFVLADVEGQSAVTGKSGETLSTQRRDPSTPPIHGRLVDVQDAGDRGLGSEVADGVGLEHGRGTYLKGNLGARGSAALIGNGVPGDNARQMRTVKKKPDPAEVGKRIRFLREARGLSQEALARKLIELGAPSTISKSTVAKWETAQTDPTKMENVTTFYLLKVLGTEHAFLLFGPDVDAREGDDSASAAKR